jgi:membrane associated rhomboid family serine protease
MIPLKDDNPIERFPFITLGIIVVNALVYIYQLTLPALPLEA